MRTCPEREPRQAAHAGLLAALIRKVIFEAILFRLLPGGWLLTHDMWLIYTSI